MTTITELQPLTINEQSWQQGLAAELCEPYMLELHEFLQQQAATKKVIYPSKTNIFKAFEQTPLNQVKVVILGQDPYHGEGQAHGLSFSVEPGVRIPPSLLNIYKELKEDCNIPLASHGCLQSWCQQGVLLLNSVLTVEAGQAASHQGKGWEQFTDKVIALLNQQDRPIVFVLWGAYAQKKGAIINTSRHKVIKSTHPSPLSAHRGFLGSKPFSQINDFLISTQQKPINWAVLSAG